MAIDGSRRSCAAPGHVVNAKRVLRLMHEDNLPSPSFAVTNLFNKRNYFGQNENVAAFGVSTGIVGRPREWMVTLRRTFEAWRAVGDICRPERMVAVPGGTP